MFRRIYQISSNFLEETVTLIESNTNIKIVTSTIYYYGGKQGQLIPKSYNLDIILAENQIVITSPEEVITTVLMDLVYT